LIVADETTPIVFQLSSDSCHDDPQARKSIPKLPGEYGKQGLSLLMDKAYEGDEVRSSAESHGLKPVVPPKSNRKEPWQYDTELDKRRNEVERYFRRLKAYRRVFTRYDKLDVMYASFVTFAMICETLRS
jgi:transposase